MLSAKSKILIPTDFSDYSKKAFETAITLAEKFGSEIILFHAIEPPYNFASSVDDMLSKMKNNAKSQLDEWITKHLKEKKLNVTSIIETGMAISSILETIRDSGIDMVVMGSKGETGFAKILFGSVATDVMLHSPVPVLTIPPDFASFELNKILFTTGYRKNDLRSLREIDILADQFNAEIEILHIVHEEDDFESTLKGTGFEELVKKETGSKHYTFSSYYHENTLNGISEYLDRNPASLVVLTRYKKSVIGKLLGKKHTDKITGYVNIPVLVMTN